MAWLGDQNPPIYTKLAYIIYTWIVRRNMKNKHCSVISIRVMRLARPLPRLANLSIFSLYGIYQTLHFLCTWRTLNGPSLSLCILLDQIWYSGNKKYGSTNSLHKWKIAPLGLEETPKNKKCPLPVSLRLKTGCFLCKTFKALLLTISDQHFSTTVIILNDIWVYPISNMRKNGKKREKSRGCKNSFSAGGSAIY